jgi:hypothetical protein
MAVGQHIDLVGGTGPVEDTGIALEDTEIPVEDTAVEDTAVVG